MLTIFALAAAAAAGNSHTPFGFNWLAPRVTAVHNEERTRAGVGPMRWDSALARDAEAYARQLARLGDMRHSSPDVRRGQGENLWMGTRGAFTYDRMVRDWASEKNLFRAGAFPAVSRSGSWHDVGHYTQMIWPQTARVGCGIAQSAQWDFLVCRYTPGGNVMGQRVP